MYTALGVAAAVTAFMAVLTVAHAGEDKLYGELDKYGLNLMIMPVINDVDLDLGDLMLGTLAVGENYIAEEKLPQIMEITDGATDQIGVYQIHDPGYGIWVLDDGNGYWNADGDVVHYFGGPDTVPVVGDWDGTPTPNPCHADFLAVPTYCDGPTWVQFQDKSTGDITAWEWDLDGDGITDTYAQNPSYFYDTNGYYSVTLTITGPACEDTLTKPDYIDVTGCST